MWWFRSLIRPLMARLAFIQVMEGKLNPWWETGRVVMMLDGWKEKPRTLWTFHTITLSSDSASTCLIDCRKRSAQHCETMFWETIFHKRVIDSHPMIVGNLKVSMKALSSLKQETGLLTFIHRKSNSSAMSSTLCFVTSKGLVLDLINTEWNSAWFRWSFGPPRT